MQGRVIRGILVVGLVEVGYRLFLRDYVRHQIGIESRPAGG